MDHACSKMALANMVGKYQIQAKMYGPRTGAPPYRSPYRNPYRPSTVLPEPAPYRFARTGPVPFCLYKPLPKLQALHYDILPSTTAVFSYAIGSRKLSDNEQFFVGAQTVVNLLQTTQIISDVCFITDYVAYASSNKTTLVRIETELCFYPGWMRLMFTCVLNR